LLSVLIAAPAISAEDYQHQVKNATRAIEKNPKDARAYARRGFAWYYIEKYELAIKDLDKAVELNPNYEYAYVIRGMVYNMIEDYEQAMKDFSKAIELEPRDEAAYNNRGIVYKKLRNYQQAIKDYNKAIELAPDFALAYSNRGQAYEMLHNYQQAIKDHDKAVELDPKNRIFVDKQAKAIKRKKEHTGIFGEYMGWAAPPPSDVKSGTVKLKPTKILGKFLRLMGLSNVQAREIPEDTGITRAEVSRLNQLWCVQFTGLKARDSTGKEYEGHGILFSDGTYFILYALPMENLHEGLARISRGERIKLWRQLDDLFPRLGWAVVQANEGRWGNSYIMTAGKLSASFNRPRIDNENKFDAHNVQLLSIEGLPISRETYRTAEARARNIGASVYKKKSKSSGRRTGVDYNLAFVQWLGDTRFALQPYGDYRYCRAVEYALERYKAGKVQTDIEAFFRSR